MHHQSSRRRCRWWCPMISRMSHRSQKSQSPRRRNRNRCRPLRLRSTTKRPALSSTCAEGGKEAVKGFEFVLAVLGAVAVTVSAAWYFFDLDRRFGEIGGLSPELARRLRRYTSPPPAPRPPPKVYEPTSRGRYKRR